MNKSRETPIRIIIKKSHHGGHHGGAWKVAFADFMTAMFAMFLVLWLVNQSSDVKSAIAGYFQDPLGRADEFGSSILPGEGSQSSVPQPLSARQVIDLRRDRMRSLGDELERELRDIPELKEVADKVQIEVTEDGLRIQLLEDQLGVDLGGQRSQQRPDVGADPAAPGVQREGVDDHAGPAGHRPSSAAARTGARSPSPRSARRWVSAMPREIPAITMAGMHSEPIQNVSKRPST